MPCSGTRIKGYTPTRTSCGLRSTISMGMNLASLAVNLQVLRLLQKALGIYSTEHFVKSTKPRPYE